MKSNYSKPKIYTGGVDINSWKKLSSNQQKEALSKDWYVYFSFRHPKTGKLTRQNNIKAGVNKYKTIEERLEYLKTIQSSLLMLLKKGFNPYLDNSDNISKIFDNSDQSKVDQHVTNQVKNIPDVKLEHENEMTIKEAFEFALKIKKKVLNTTSYSGFQGRIQRFLKWLDENNSTNNKISTLSKKTFTDYFNYVLEKTSARNRNNTRIDLSSLVQVLVDNDILKVNYIKSINVLKSSPERNKTYSNEQEIAIMEHIKNSDPILFLFIQFITFNFLRPLEVCRLKVRDLNVKEKILVIKTKNKNNKTKIIPQIVIDALPDLSNCNPENFLFTPCQIGGEWNAEENNRRNYFSKRFKVVKDHFNLDENYGLYSFRHTSITNLYRELNKTLTPYETKSKLMMITGHQTMEALEKYLRDIDADLPEDYSHLLKVY